MKTFNYIINNEPLSSIIDFATFKDEKNVLIQIFCGEKKDILRNKLEEITKEFTKAICRGSSTGGEISHNTQT